MYKIRLYVVPEQEEVPEPDDLEELDLAPSPMQRKNSRRPGAVRVNVIQKDRRAQDKIAPKIRQLRQEIEKPSRIGSQLKPVELNGNSPRKRFDETRPEVEAIEAPGKENAIEFSRDETREEKPRNDESAPRNGESVRQPPPVPFRVSSLPQGSVFASPRIRQLALNLQEKMLERGGADCDNDRKTVEEIKIGRSSPTGRTTGNKIVTRSATTASRIQRFDRERNSLTRTSSAGGKRSARECSVRKSGRREQIQGGRSPKIVRVKDEVDAKVAANSVILRRNNKLNGYRVSLCARVFFKTIFFFCGLAAVVTFSLCLGICFYFRFVEHDPTKENPQLVGAFFLRVA